MRVLLGAEDTEVTKRDKYLFTMGTDVLVEKTVKSSNKRVKCAVVWMVASAVDKIK